MTESVNHGVVERPASRQEQFQVLNRELNLIASNFEENAKEKGLLNTKTYAYQKAAIVEVRNILQGVVTIHEGWRQLESCEIMLSYSSKNSEKANFVHLATRSTGGAVWFDRQETTPHTDYAPPPYLAGIHEGKPWMGEIEEGIPYKGYGFVLLTHEMLDKFDIVSKEISRIVKNKNRPVVLTIEDPKQRQTLMQRVKDMAENTQDASERECLLALIGQQTIPLNEEHFSGSHRDLGNYLVESLVAHEKGEIPPMYSKESSSHEEKTQQTGSENKSSILEKIAALKKKLMEKSTYINSIERQILMQHFDALNESGIIMQGILKPETLQEDLQRKEFVVPNFSPDISSTVQEFKTDMEKLGLSEGGEDRFFEKNYTFIILYKAMFAVPPDELIKRLKEIKKHLNIPGSFILSFDEDIAKELRKLSTETTGEAQKIIEDISKLQIRVFAPEDAKNMLPTVSYVLTRELLKEKD